MIEKGFGTLRNHLGCSVLLHSPNTAYTAHFVRPNFGFVETSYMLGTLDELVFL